jgi:hypothetical protein
MGLTVGYVKACYMQQETMIDSSGYEIAAERDENIGALELKDNKLIFYLPENVSEVYPNLLAITAQNCVIREISFKNFKGLSKLRLLNLGGNQIETIEMDTFKDATELNEIYFCKKTNFKISTFLINFFFRFQQDQQTKRSSFHRSQQT